MPAATDIRPESSERLLKELHILTRDGRLNQDSRRKLKQVYHLVQFIEPLLHARLAEQPQLTLVDHGAGKSYLGFILYDLILKFHAGAHAIGIETRPALVERSVALAAELGFARMRFLNLPIEQAITAEAIPGPVDAITALHACDTATDDAIRFGLARGVPLMVLVPCCQAEVAAELRRTKATSLSRGALAELWRHPLHTREFGSTVTNALRCLLLEAHGYQVSVTELVGWEHSLKNELIIARRAGPPRGNARDRTLELLDQLGLRALERRFAY